MGDPTQARRARFWGEGGVGKAEGKDGARGIGTKKAPLSRGVATGRVNPLAILLQTLEGLG